MPFMSGPRAPHPLKAKFRKNEIRAADISALFCLLFAMKTGTKSAELFLFHLRKFSKRGKYEL